jgi:hypothetical protein
MFLVPLLGTFDILTIVQNKIINEKVMAPQNKEIRTKKTKHYKG